MMTVKADPHKVLEGAHCLHLVPCPGELGYILDGNVSSGVDVEQPNLPGRAGFVQHPLLADEMHVVFFVVPCEESSNPEYMNRLKLLKRFCTDRGKGRNISATHEITTFSSTCSGAVSDLISNLNTSFL